MLVAGVDVVADRLADKMCGNGETLQAMLGEQGALGIAVGLIGFGDIEVIAPAGEFHAIVAEGFDLGEEGFEGEVGPLAGEQGDGS